MGFFSQYWTKMGHPTELLGAVTLTTIKKRGSKNSGRLTISNFIPYIALLNFVIFALNFLFSFIMTFIFLLRKRPDIVVVSVPPGDLGMGAVFACQLMHFPIIIDYRDEWEDFAIGRSQSIGAKYVYKKIRRFVGLLYTRSAKVVILTTGPIDQLQSRNVTNIALIPNGVDLSIFKPQVIPGKKFSVVYSGLISEYYRLDIVSRAISWLRETGIDDVSMRILSPGKTDSLRKWAKSLAIETNVEDLGSRDSPSEVAQVLRTSSVGVVPFDDNPLWDHALPAKFLEYCACGIPVIASVNQWSILSKTIKEHKLGIVVPPLDALSMAKALKRLYKDATLRKTFGKNARRFVERYHNKFEIADKYLQLLKRVENNTRT